MNYNIKHQFGWDFLTVGYFKYIAVCDCVFSENSLEEDEEVTLLLEEIAKLQQRVAQKRKGKDGALFGVKFNLG